ncbi:MAG: SDR family oxidoreductase [Cyclobacteriaceae bacterium]|nr:SDR family oxidoreductase [Cyclobacteriaceae bacterium]MCH8517445.1 SDR family oxidoreductase [Cyclobacteriaceae bacterium]
MEIKKNQVAFITGGSKGIGYGVAEALLKQGMRVAITSRSQSSADEAASRLKNHGDVLALASDVSNYEFQKSAIDEVMKKWGQIDCYVANAGVGKFGSIEDLSIDDWHQVINTNLTGVFYSIKSSLSALKESKGMFITISSLAGTNFFAGGAAYNASKFGLTGFTQAVMLDLRQSGVRVSTIMPGSVATYFNDHTPNDADSWKIQIEDIGQMVVDLLKMPARTLPSKIEVRPSMPPGK